MLYFLIIQSLIFSTCLGKSYDPDLEQQFDPEFLDEIFGQVTLASCQGTQELECSGRGNCYQGKCQCREGYSGQFCEVCQVMNILK